MSLEIWLAQEGRNDLTSELQIVMGEIRIYNTKLALFSNSKWSDSGHRLILEEIKNTYMDSIYLTNIYWRPRHYVITWKYNVTQRNYVVYKSQLPRWEADRINISMEL